MKGSKKMKLNDKIIEVLETNNFSVYEITKQGDDYYIEISQYTPLGEDWWVTVWFDGTDNGFIESIREIYENFDVDEETEIWIESRGKNGVPNSIKALVEDAEWKQATLGELASDFEKIEE
jgi:hypothetical protein